MSASRVAFEKHPPLGRYRLLLDTAEMFAHARSLTGAVREFVPPVLGLMQGNLLSLSLHDRHRDLMITQYWKSNGESGECAPLPAETSVASHVWKQQRAITIADTGQERRFPGCAPLLAAMGVRTFTAVPVSTSDNHFGALGLGKAVPEVLEVEDVELLSGIAVMGAMALEKERTHGASEERQSLFEMSRALGNSLDLDSLLHSVLASVRRIARYDRAVLFLLEADGEHVRLYGDALEWRSGVDRGNLTSVRQSLSGQAIEKRQVALLGAEDLRAIQSPLTKAMIGDGIQSVCSVPLIAQGRVWGALNTSSESANAFGPTEVEYLEQVAGVIATALHNAHAHREIEMLKNRLAVENQPLGAKLRSTSRAEAIVGGSAALKHALNLATIVATTDSTVLITGETGTGKERIARMIHAMSARRERSFIKVNCAAIPTGLLESELFGHERGAFTGAISQKVGRLELANQGTLLLDEVGEIPVELQPKLLRVLQDQEFERLGGTKTIRVNVRILAATNRDLVKAVEQREFREDLFYRLRVFPLHVPPLRERPEDIPKLVEHFVRECCARMNKRIEVVPDAALEAMKRWRWPGNIRELENFIERAVILSEGTRLNAPLDELRDDGSGAVAESDGTLRERERGHILEVLRQTRGVLSGPEGAAARLGLKRTTLQYKMQRLGITRKDDME